MRNPEEGVVLVNVLAVVALASVTLVAMLSLQDISIHRSQRFSEAAQAIEIARGVEASVVTALRRDAVQSPNLDHAGEEWALIAEEDRAIEGGTLRLGIEDAQVRFNINALVDGGVAAREALRRILLALDQPPALADEIAAELRSAGPVPRLSILIERGITPDAVAALSLLVTALPLPASVNINAADEALIALLLKNPVAARRLAAVRDRKGFLTPADVRGIGVLIPQGIGFRSDHFRTEIEVSIGGTVQRISSLIQRRQIDGRAKVVVIARQRERALPN